ncbi:TonB-dependent receptor [Novosphingobium sp. 9U]|uniref:TonB-dependent receptor n=1 Tax=Novosphingobium sp. 9U TaxID=2653158 RepID=UPI0012F16AE1|nr:TonB-dependent receptor plug domain-containing protein [Novosphingobium sp. 9U]VWX50165.1 conserved exported hypothetical protein [Novosphingobium sp. 9U]
MNGKIMLLAGVCMLPAAPALAQSAPEQPSDEIVVTAQRRSENLSRTPVAVTVLSAQALAEAQITRSDDLRAAAPGLSVRSGLSSEQLNFSLRGNTQDPFSNVRPGVMPYFNEVQIGSQSGSSAFYDLQSVQVLKGPQGTLFGRSATGGALLFTTHKPEETLGGYASALYGNYDQARAEGAINLPLSGDDLLLRVAGFYSRRDGFQHNLFTGKDEGKQRKFGFRPSLTAHLGPDVTNELVVDYYKSNSENTVGVISGLLPYTGTGTPYVPAAYLYAGTSTPTATLTGQCAVQGFAGLGACPPVSPLVSGFYNAYFAAHPTAGLSGELAAQQARGPYDINVDGENIADNRTTIVTNTTTVRLSDTAKLKNIFGLVDAHSLTGFEADGTVFGIAQTGPRGSGQGLAAIYHGVTEELQLVGTAGKLDYVVGGYYANEKSITNFVTQYFDVVFGGVSQANIYRITNETLAGYGQVTYHLGDTGVGLTGGLRYTREKVGKTLLPGDAFFEALGPTPPAGYSLDKRRTFENLSWTLGLQYQASPQLLFYAVSRRAFRSGGFNGQSPPVEGDGSVGGDLYRPERVTDAEVGAKFNGRLGAMPFRISADGYYNWISDSQRAAFAFIGGNIATVTVNVPKAHTYGAELEAQVKPIEVLTLGGTFNYTNAKFTDRNVSVVGVPQVFDQVPDTPKTSGALFADVRVPAGSLTLLAHGDAYHQSATTTSPRSANFAGTRISGYTTANFRLGVSDEVAGWSIIANLKNAFKKVYYVGGLQAGEIYQVNTLVPGEPRTFTVEGRISF